MVDESSRRRGKLGVYDGFEIVYVNFGCEFRETLIREMTDDVGIFDLD